MVYKFSTIARTLSLQAKLKKPKRCHSTATLHLTVYTSISMQTDTTTLPLAAAWNGVHSVLSYSFSRATSSGCTLKWITHTGVNGQSFCRIFS